MDGRAKTGLHGAQSRVAEAMNARVVYSVLLCVGVDVVLWFLCYCFELMRE